jgi:hypothetical protein
VLPYDVADGNGEEVRSTRTRRVYTEDRQSSMPHVHQHESMHWWTAYVQAVNERETDLNHILLNCVPTAHLQANVASHYGPIAADPSNARSHAHLRHIYDYRGKIGVLNVPGSHVDEAIESGLENGHRQGCSGRAIAGIYRAGDHRDLICHRSGAVWVKVYDYRGAGAQVSVSEVRDRHGVCRCGYDAAPCAPPFRASLPFSPLFALLCVVSVQPSLQLLWPHQDPHAHWLSVRREGGGWHLCPCLVYLSMMFPSWMARNRCMSECQ